MARPISVKARIVILLVSLALYIVACCKPAAAFSIAGNDGTTSGLGALLCGLLEGPRGLLAWSSNWLYGIGVLTLGFGSARACFVMTTLATVMALRVFFPYSGLIFLEAKYWWLASYCVLACGSLLLCTSLDPIPHPPEIQT